MLQATNSKHERPSGIALPEKHLPPAPLPLPAVVWAALELRRGRIPTNGLPKKVSEIADLVMCYYQDRERYLDLPARDLMHGRGMTFDEEQAIDAGDPEAVAAIHLQAIEECITILCDLTWSASSVTQNHRLHYRIAFACQDELDQLVEGYLDAIRRRASSITASRHERHEAQEVQNQ